MIIIITIISGLTTVAGFYATVKLTGNYSGSTENVLTEAQKIKI
jgi:hypothetical protein